MKLGEVSVIYAVLYYQLYLQKQPPGVFCKVFLEILQISQESNSARVSF